MLNSFHNSYLTIKSVNIYHMLQACGLGGSFGRQEAILPCCIFTYSDREWTEPLKQNIFKRCVLRTSCLQMTCRYTHKTPYLLLIKRLVETQTSTAAQPDAGWSRQVVWWDGRRKGGEMGGWWWWWRGGGGRQAGRHTLFPSSCDAMIRRH